MIECPVCGKTYGVTHSCGGPSLSKSALAAKWPVPTEFAPLHYFRQAVAIARLDDAAIVAASVDKNALLYGAVIFLIEQLLTLSRPLWAAVTRAGVVNWLGLTTVTLLLILVDAIWLVAVYGICHLLARGLFGARGTYLGVLRPLLLGRVVGWFIVIPYVGLLIAAFWTIAVMMIVFEEVDGIKRLQAFGLAAVINTVFWVLTLVLLTPR